MFFFVFKEKAAYEVRMSDWSSDVCSSDLRVVSIGRSAGEICGISAFRKEPATFVLDDECIARVEETLIPGRTAQHFQPFLVIGRADQDGRERPLAILRSEEHTSELQSLMRISYAVFWLKKKRNILVHTMSI